LALKQHSVVAALKQRGGNANGAGRMTSGLCKVLIFLKDFQSA
jgi:hypothetical protein